MIPTDEQTKQEIDRLKELLPKIREFSAFGDNNKLALKAQINVLKHKLTETEIQDLYDRQDYVLDSALGAFYWVIGEGETDTLVEDWEGLVIE